MKKFVLIFACLVLLGCARMQISTPQAILLPEDRIFTVPAGQEINVLLDKKPLTITFPTDMKLVSPTILIRQEEQLNNALFDKIGADKKRTQTTAVFGGIITLLTTIGGIFLKMKANAASKKA